MSDSTVQSFRFQPEHDGTLSLESAVFQALGAASTCWSSMAGKGIFESDRAKTIGEALLEKIQEEKSPAIISGELTDIGPECFTNGDVISYKGENFYRACGAFVSDLENGGQSFCVKPVGHPVNIHEDHSGCLRMR